MKNTRPFYAYLDELDMITVIMPVSYLEEEVSFFQLETDGVLHDLEIVEKRELDGEKKYVCKSPVQPLFGKTHYIIDERGGRTDLQIGAVIRTDAFDDQFYYPANDLGAVYEPKATSFKVWAPTAVRAVLLLKKKNEEKALSIEMTRDKNGVYSLIVPGDLEGSFYRYKVLINNEWREAADPYSRAVSIHSEWSSIIDDRKTYVKPIQPAPLPSPLDAIIYEISIRDFSIHPESGMLHKGKYLALTEAQTSGKKGTPTGLSYLKELGITHVEFLPFNDFYGVPDDNPSAAYNWGYNPLFFNVPEGSYSSDPTNPYSRVVELKKMIEAVHETGLRVIMDVVYNHVYIRETSPFEILVPGYYFRHDQHGLPSNGTGVGNDFASERKMARAFILHSLEYWITEFNIDGFRFDLMGILDIQTMTEAKKIISKHKKDCLLLGEGWDLNTPLAREKKANMRNQQLLPGIGQFNDWFRDTIKGSTFNLYDSGYSFGRKSLAGDAFQVIAGSVGLGHNRGIFATPEQSINYVESHDNNTLWDKLEACFPGEIEKNKKRHQLATAIVLLSQGIPFLHSGQEFFRTKKGEENSYASPDEINWIDWDRKEENLEAVNYVKGLIALRKSHGGFRLRSASLIRKHVTLWKEDEGTLGVWIKDVQDFGEWKDILLIFHPKDEAGAILLPEWDCPWKILAAPGRVEIQPFKEAADSLRLDPWSCYVCVQ